MLTINSVGGYTAPRVAIGIYGEGSCSFIHWDLQGMMTDQNADVYCF